MDTPKDIVKLQQEELNVMEIIDLVTAPNCGAISNFIGITRDHFENKRVLKLEYEAYESMALKEMKNICLKIRLQWNIHHIAIYHRVGEVPVSKASIVIAISSIHRKESLLAVEYAINAFKANVPIWKKEVYDAQESEWKQNAECAWSNIYNVNSSKHVKSVAGSNEIIEAESGNNGCPIVEKAIDEGNVTIDPNFVQICATSNELSNRISAFIERKRQLVNIVNVQEFCCHRKENNVNENSCARVDAILIRRTDSKSHVKVHRVFNTWGPQMADQQTLHKVVIPEKNQTSHCSFVLDERISISEKILGINRPVPKDMYARLKNIEDRILYLEGISPEYVDFWKSGDINYLKGACKPIRKRMYSAVELDTKLQELQSRYAKKPK